MIQSRRIAGGDVSLGSPSNRLHRTAHEQFYADVVAGLSNTPKRLPCKYFYDSRGSHLFEAICELDEYYLTRTELAIMRRYSPAIAEVIGPGAMLVEYGSGSSIKTRWLLDELLSPTSYVPVDISRKHLFRSARAIATRYPAVEVLPVCADFATSFELPASLHEPARTIVYFPGSTIGNFEHCTAVELLANMREQCGKDGGVIVGIDLQKGEAIIEAAYNDSRGITADFNLNLLVRIHRELGGEFAVEQFAHRAIYDRQHHRVDLRLVSRCQQQVRIGRHAFQFFPGEMIHTEYSHKYSLDQFADLAHCAGLAVQQVWTDDRRYFAVVYLVPSEFTGGGTPRSARRPR